VLHGGASERKRTESSQKSDRGSAKARMDRHSQVLAGLKVASIFFGFKNIVIRKFFCRKEMTTMTMFLGV
jgi:hypothetical protein